MKKIILIIIIILLFGFKTKTVFLDLPLMGKRIYLDAGHGGVDSGARYKDILEKDINLKLVLKFYHLHTPLQYNIVHHLLQHHTFQQYLDAIN